MLRLATLLLAALAGASPANAHSAARGFVMLLPTQFVITAGAFAILVTFLVAALLPDRLFLKEATPGDAPERESRPAPILPSLVSATLLVGLIAMGFTGSHDPLENLLPLTVWTVWWVVIVLLHPLLGNLWAVINPFTGLATLLQPGRPGTANAALTRLGYLPAMVLFAGFAWFQLIDPSPEDPPRLAWVVSLYAGFTLLAILVVGREPWLRRCDPFSVFLRQVAAVAPLGPGFRLHWPGTGLVNHAPLPLSGVLFILLTLSSITFDALAHTFAWLGLIGVNPLDFPGRTALIWPNSLGLLLSFIVLAGAFALAIALGWIFVGKPGRLRLHLGHLVFSLIPISIAFHFAHYLNDLLVNTQYVALALNDPLESGANLLGFATAHVTTSFQNTAQGTLLIFTAQSCAVILGHVIAVVVAHAMVVRLGLTRRRTLMFEAPLALLMIGYTALGLWLLATPVAT